MKLKNKLIQLNAEKEMINVVGNLSIEEEWNKSERGDWMLWFYRKICLYSNHEDSNYKKYILASVHCAITVKRLMCTGDTIEEAEQALKAGLLFAKGRISKNMLYSAYCDICDRNHSLVNCGDSYSACSSAEASISVDSCRWIHNAPAFSADAVYQEIIYNGECPPEYESYSSKGKERVIKRALKRQKENQKKTADICRKYLDIGEFTKKIYWRKRGIK